MRIGLGKNVRRNHASGLIMHRVDDLTSPRKIVTLRTNDLMIMTTQLDHTNPFILCRRLLIRPATPGFVEVARINPALHPSKSTGLVKPRQHLSKKALTALSWNAIAIQSMSIYSLHRIAYKPPPHGGDKKLYAEPSSRPRPLPCQSYGLCLE